MSLSRKLLLHPSLSHELLLLRRYLTNFHQRPFIPYMTIQNSTTKNTMTIRQDRNTHHSCSLSPFLTLLSFCSLVHSPSSSPVASLAIFLNGVHWNRCRARSSMSFAVASSAGWLCLAKKALTYAQSSERFPGFGTSYRTHFPWVESTRSQETWFSFNQL